MTERTHDDFYKRLRERIEGWADRNRIKRSYRDALLSLPDLFHLTTRLLLDPRVSVTDKGILGAAAAYVISPVDLIPDVLGPIGFIDDLLVATIALDTVLKRVPIEVVAEHWAGRADVYEQIREILDRADDWFGKGLVRRVRGLLVELGVLAPKAAPPPPPPSGAKTRKSASKKKTAKKAASKKKTATKKSASKKKTAAKTSASKKKTVRKKAARKTARKRSAG